MKRVLTICDDVWHPGETVRHGLASLREKGFEFEFLEGDGTNLPGMLPEFPIVVLARSNLISAAGQRPWLTPDLAAAFQNHLRRGNGLVAIHAGTARYESTPGMREMIGGAFVRHPEQCGVTVEPVAGRALAAGIAPFSVRDEHYFMTPVAADAEIFLHSRSAHGLQPAGWTRTEGAGRVCVLTPGHNLEVWRHPEFQKLLLNGMNWVAKVT